MEPVVSEAARALISYGALGVVALAAIAAVIYLYRDSKTERERNRLAEAALVDRYVSKSDTMNSKYHELADAMTAAMSAQRQLVERMEERDERRERIAALGDPRTTRG